MSATSMSMDAGTDAVLRWVDERALAFGVPPEPIAALVAALASALWGAQAEGIQPVCVAVLQQPSGMEVQIRNAAGPVDTFLLVGP